MIGLGRPVTGRKSRLLVNSLNTYLMMQADLLPRACVPSSVVF
jgi:hypothetical protein